MRLAITGDIFIHATAAGCEHPGHLAVLEFLRRSDHRIGNLDLTITDRGYPSPKPDIYRALPSVADEIARLRFDLVSLANTHSTDFGADGLWRTMTLLERAGVRSVGAGLSMQAAFEPVILASHDLRVAIIAAVVELPGQASTTLAAGLHSPGVALIPNYAVTQWQPGQPPRESFAPGTQEVRALISALTVARQTADVVIFLLHAHWPPPLKTFEAGYILPHLAIDHGADLVVAHGSHLIEAVEAYRGRLIVHGIGNLFFQLPTPDLYGFLPETSRALGRVWSNEALWHGLVAELELSATGPPGLRLLPVSMSREAPVGWPQLAEGEARARIIDALQTSSAGDSVLFGDDGLTVSVSSPNKWLKPGVERSGV